MLSRPNMKAFLTLTCYSSNPLIIKHPGKIQIISNDRKKERAYFR